MVCFANRPEFEPECITTAAIGGLVESGLYIVATPIGNLADLGQRAVEVLQASDLIACEDTRHSRHLLQHYQVERQCIAYHEHSGDGATLRLLDCLGRGGIVALVSDAGTPLISDPGYRLVREAQDQGYRVIPIPGPCAAIAALSAGGLPTDRFRFEGFLPARQAARCSRLQQLEAVGSTLVFYEAPHRIHDTLEDMIAVFGPEREAVLARELSKSFETIRRDSLVSLEQFVAGDGNQQRGEIVLLVAGCGPREQVLDDQALALLQRLAEELPPKKAAAVVADVYGLRKKTLYDYLLQNK